MSDYRPHDFEEVLAAFREDPEYRKEERRIKPYTELVVQIITRRSDLQITQKQLADIAGTHQSRISKIESGEHDIRLSTLIDIAEALNCEVNICLVPVDEPKHDVQNYAPLFSKSARVSGLGSPTESKTEKEKAFVE